MIAAKPLDSIPHRIDEDARESAIPARAASIPGTSSSSFSQIRDIFREQFFDLPLGLHSGMSSSAKHRAAQYVRMSTDMQRYSLENQREAIALYAASRGLTIVRSYEDAGRSGLGLATRDALKTLISDVTSGRADFQIVLVYDVSRWGRFQDCDEGAYYEFICKEAGVTIEYCAEEFENDGSLAAAVLKSIKRAMAGEYSRELSKKVFAGQTRVASLGFHVGAAAGYGLRRCLLDEDGKPKMELRLGQRKSLHTERVILVPGPQNEVATVNYVYDLFIQERKSLNAIARILNAHGIPNVNGRSWSRLSVRQLLANEKYAGNCLYNRSTKKLGSKLRRNPPDRWTRRIGAFEPVVVPQRFEMAQRQLKENASAYDENDMLDRLTAIWCREKYLSRDIIESSPNVPSPNTYKKHFGSISNAYRRVGYASARTANRERFHNWRRGICKEIVARVSELGGAVRVPPGCHAQLRVNSEISVTIVLGHTSDANIQLQQNQWRFCYRSRRKPDFLLVGRVDHQNLSLRDYFILPYIFMPPSNAFTLSGRNYELLEGFRVSSLAPFCELCSRVPLLQGGREPSLQTCLPPTSDDDPSRAEHRASVVLDEARVILSDENLKQLLGLLGIQTLPGCLGNDSQQTSLNEISLRFVVAWAFLGPLFAAPVTASYLDKRWPGFMLRAQDSFTALASDGAFSRAMRLHRLRSMSHGGRRL